MASDSIRALSATVSGLKQAMEVVRQEKSEDVGKWSAATSYARRYSEMAQRYAKLSGDSTIRIFDIDKLKGWADMPWPGQKELFDTVYAQTLILSNLVTQGTIDPPSPMYNLFVSASEEAWQGQPFQVDLSRCLREYTSSSITMRYGALDKPALTDLKRLPCIFAFESGCDLSPRFGFVRDVIVRQGQVRVEYEIHVVEPFLSAKDLQEMSFELDIGKLELFRTHWATKEVNLPKELHARGITLPASVRDVSNPVDISQHEFEVALSFPGESRPLVEKISQELERRLGPNSYFYDLNYVSQLAQPSLDVLLQGVYRRAKLVVAFLSRDYQKKDWCGLEFRVVKDTIFAREPWRVMFVRTDDGEVEGVMKTDGYLDARNFTPEQLARFISERLELLHKRKP